MKILVDTNVLISAVTNENGRPNTILRHISQSDDYELYLTDQNIEEFKEVIERKMPRFSKFVGPFLSKLDYEVVAVVVDNETVAIRDAKDQPILNAAILNDLDVILTGDKDFLALELDRPKCITPVEFCELEKKNNS